MVIGISGASGQLARRTLALVVEKVGAGNVVAITRDPGKLQEFADLGVVVRQGDFAAPESLPAVLEGVDRLLLVSVDDARPGVRPKLHGNAIAAAKQAGVQHVVYTSAIKPFNSPIAFLRDHAATEQIIVESGLAYTVLRNNFYMEVVLQTAGQALATGTIFSAAQGGAVAYVCRDDCARAAAAVLASDGHEGAIYDITGPYAWTSAEIAELLGRITERTIAYVPLSEDALRQGMVDNGVPPQVAEFVAGIDRGVRLGGLDCVSRSVERLTGTKPESLEDFLLRNKAALTNPAST